MTDLNFQSEFFIPVIIGICVCVGGRFMDHKGDYELITSDHDQKLYVKAVVSLSLSIYR